MFGVIRVCQVLLRCSLSASVCLFLSEALPLAVCVLYLSASLSLSVCLPACLSIRTYEYYSCICMHVCKYVYVYVRMRVCKYVHKCEGIVMQAECSTAHASQHLTYVDGTSIISICAYVQMCTRHACIHTSTWLTSEPLLKVTLLASLLQFLQRPKMLKS